MVKITSKGTSLPKVRNHFTKIKTLHRYPPFFPLTLRKIRRCYDWPLKDGPTFTYAHVPNAVPYNGIISGTLSTESPQRQAAALRDLVELVKYRIVYRRGRSKRNGREVDEGIRLRWISHGSRDCEEETGSIKNEGDMEVRDVI